MSLDLIAKWDANWSERFPVRITKKQKERFLEELESELAARRFETERITVRTLIRNRLLVTKCEQPRVIFLAHFDTPTIMPFWIASLFNFVGHTRQITGSVLILALIYIPVILSTALNSYFLTAFTNLFTLVILLSLVSLLIPNPRNREDNTSGIIGLMALAEWLKDKPRLKEQVQFVFLDNEELGLLGSKGLRRLWDKEGHPYNEAIIINLDCVSRGQKPLIVYHKNDTIAQKVLPYLQAYLPETETIDLTILPLSDNYTFRKEGAIDISYADPSLFPGGYTIPRIHSPADKDFFPEKLLAIINGLTEFLAQETGDADGNLNDQ